MPTYDYRSNEISAHCYLIIVNGKLANIVSTTPPLSLHRHDGFVFDGSGSSGFDAAVGRG